MLILKVYCASEELQKVINDGSVGIAGAVYDINTGKVIFKDYSEEIRKVEQISYSNLEIEQFVQRHQMLLSSSIS